MWCITWMHPDAACRLVKVLLTWGICAECSVRLSSVTSRCFTLWLNLFVLVRTFTMIINSWLAASDWDRPNHGTSHPCECYGKYISRPVGYYHEFWVACRLFGWRMVKNRCRHSYIHDWLQSTFYLLLGTLCRCSTCVVCMMSHQSDWAFNVKCTV